MFVCTLVALCVANLTVIGTSARSRRHAMCSLAMGVQSVSQSVCVGDSYMDGSTVTVRGDVFVKGTKGGVAGSILRSDKGSLESGKPLRS